VRPDGTVKVLDFGLAKAVEPAVISASSASVSPTITSPAMTQAGVILGTAAYMSPEQAKGQPADKRSDVWAFGCVLYEMLAGKRAFGGDDVSDTLAAVLRAEPDWTALQAGITPAIRAVIQGCLVKNRRERIGDVSAAIFLLRQPTTELTPSPIGGVSIRRHGSFWFALAATALIFGIAGAVAAWRVKQESPRSVVRFAIPLDGFRFSTANRGIAISPDGTRIAYTTGSNPTDQHAGASQLFVRSLDAADPRPLGPPIPIASGTLGQPFFSPDGEWIGFYSSADQTLKKISVNGGTPLTICKGDAQPIGVTWDGEAIVFVERGVGIKRVSADGGQPETIVRVNPSESVIGPQLLDDGRSVLFSLATESGLDLWDKAAIVVQSLQSGQRTVVVRGGADARYVNGRLVYAVGDTLWAVAFDPRTVRTTGRPAPVLQGVSRTSTGRLPAGQARFAVSSSGTLVYVPGALSETSGSRLLMRGDSSGNEHVLPLPPQPYLHPRLSPNGRQLAFGTDDGKDAIVWVVDDVNGAVVPRRLTFQGRNLYPIWTPDGQYVTFQSDREGDRGLFRQRADGAMSSERLTRADPQAIHTPSSWTPDGKTLAFSSSSPANASSLWTVSLDGDRKPRPLPDTTGLPSFNASFSPDGRWIVYSASTTQGGPPYLFLQPFPPTGAKYQLTTDVSTGAAWSVDGRQIFYEAGPASANRISHMEIHTSPSVVAGPPAVIEFKHALDQNATYRAYDVSPDGKQFIAVVPADGAAAAQPRAPQINVVLNWLGELNERVTTK
jgi:serine/threonine-protein kinase